MLTVDERPSTLQKAGHYSTVFRVHLRRLIPHTHSLVNLLDCEDSFLRRIHPSSEFQELRLCGRDSVDVSLDGINHRLQYCRGLSHIGQSYVSKRLLDPVSTVDASVVLSF